MAKNKKPIEPADSGKEKERVTFFIPSDLMTDIKLISVLEGKSLTEIGETTLRSFVEKWVKDHGPLPKKQ